MQGMESWPGPGDKAKSICKSKMLLLVAVNVLDQYHCDLEYLNL